MKDHLLIDNRGLGEEGYEDLGFTQTERRTLSHRFPAVMITDTNLLMILH